MRMALVYPSITQSRDMDIESGQVPCHSLNVFLRLEGFLGVVSR